MGEVLTYDELSSDCYPMIDNGTLLLNPCGLISNTFFNDVIELNTNTGLGRNHVLDTEGITWYFDRKEKFQQVSGFKKAIAQNTSQTCTQVLGNGYDDCETYIDSDTNDIYFFWYPDNDETQYLYETYSGIISPLKGVEDEHFINWARTAGLPKFRKLYGKIDADAMSGDQLVFDLTLNYEVRSFDASKYLVVTNLESYGKESKALGIIYMIIGSLCIAFGSVVAYKYITKVK